VRELRTLGAGGGSGPSWRHDVPGSLLRQLRRQLGRAAAAEETESPDVASWGRAQDEGGEMADGKATGLKAAGITDMLDKILTIKDGVSGMLRGSSYFPLHLSMDSDVADLWEWRAVAERMAAQMASAVSESGLALEPPKAPIPACIDTAVLHGIRVGVSERHVLIGIGRCRAVRISCTPSQQQQTRRVQRETTRARSARELFVRRDLVWVGCDRKRRHRASPLPARSD